jgi:hypothetical protein
MKRCQISAGREPTKTSGTPSTSSSGLPVRVSDPHARREPRHIAAEPRVHVVLRSAGLTRDWASDRGSGSGSALDHGLERSRDLVGDVRREREPWRVVRQGQVVSARADDSLERLRLVPDAARSKRRVGKIAL